MPKSLSKTKTNPNQGDLFNPDKLFKKKCDAHYFIWDMVEFDKDILRLKLPKIILKPIELKGSLPILNEIKKEYFERLIRRPFKFYFFQNSFQKEISRDWKKIVELIEPALEFIEFKIGTTSKKKKIGKFKKLSAKQVFDIYEPKFSKNEYLKLLATKQSPDYAVIPILENRNYQNEESFIFRLRTGTGRILIVWENFSDGRATHLFITDNSNCDKRLRLIESYVIDPTPSKRALLHFKDKESKTIKRELFHIETVNHDTISSYKSNLQYIINRY
jgi:hypothetical protein